MITILAVAIIGISIITLVMSIKYKTAYAVVTNDGKVLYVANKNLTEYGVEEIKRKSDKNIEEVIIDEETQYEAILVSRNKETDEQEYIEYIMENSEIIYKYYEIILNTDTVIEKVDTIEDAKIVVNEAKNQMEIELDLMIVEKFTTDVEKVGTSSIEIATENVKNNFKEIYETVEEEVKEEVRIASLPEINGVKLTTTPVIGTITSRYGEYSRLRVGAHTGLDIAATVGTDIVAVASGKVTFAAYNGAYGNKVVIDHGNGVETLYAHTSKMYVSVGQEVEAGELIAAVGSTGNSTGAHLHLEIIQDGITLDPQTYLYSYE